MSTFSYALASQGGEIVAKMVGTISFASNDGFRNLLVELTADWASHPAAQVVLDLSGVTGIDSVGLGLLHIAREDVADLGGRIILAHPNNSVKLLLDLTNAQRFFEMRG